MKLDYGTQLSRHPIKLSFGSIRKPTLGDIAEITFPVFWQYESIIKLRPEDILTQLVRDDGKPLWELIPEEEKSTITIFDIISANKDIALEFLTVLQFFFVEKIKYADNKFYILKDGTDVSNPYWDSVGVIDKDNFPLVIEIIEQICCIDDKEDKKEQPKFKNKKAREIYEKMMNGKKQSEKKSNRNHTIPNLISAVSSMHNSINLINIWDLTIFQLIDQFNRLTTESIFEIERTRVSVWGDEKNTFDAALWYKNEFDKIGGNNDART